MTLSHALISTGTPAPFQARLSAAWRWLAGASPASPEDRRAAEAIGRLRTFTDQQLSDIGLGRSDLTIEGLTTAGARRSLLQAALDAEMVARD